MSFEETYRAHFRFVWRSLRRLGVAESDVQDAAQEVFLVVYRKLATFEGRSKMTTWLFAICLRVSQARTRRAHVRREVLDEAAFQDIPAAGEDADVQLEKRQAVEIVDAILDEMSLDQRAVFVAFELEDLSIQQIADALAIPRGTVSSRLRLAREAFRASVARREARESSLARRREAS